ncbi:ATP-binding protein [Actibacterium sp. XHP0104]|uniref:ATP-binding protein n=1 Tax=Actibacterium sp. XHP0104 TaxID=2984335 RepID=UPI0021E8CF57|nr:ATP-binding protein [Actibacterium sp. XHP0104]MCV2881947.1 ATP-binding protein [Actibacterium sp. XHP0104]
MPTAPRKPTPPEPMAGECPLGECGGQLSLNFPGQPHAVRATLLKVHAWLKSGGYSDTICGDAELVLAELLNNIAEHAYADHPDGQIDMTLSRCGDRLCVRLHDQGAELPQGLWPGAGNTPSAPAPETLAEGGFGWFLITHLGEDICYCRRGKDNVLTLRIPLADP